MSSLLSKLDPRTDNGREAFMATFSMRLRSSTFVASWLLLLTIVGCLDANTLEFDGELATPADASELNNSEAVTYALNSVGGNTDVTSTIRVTSSGMTVSVEVTPALASGISIAMSSESFTTLNTNRSFAADPISPNTGTTYAFTLPENRLISEYNIVFSNSSQIIAIATRDPVTTSETDDSTTTSDGTIATGTFTLNGEGGHTAQGSYTLIKQGDNLVLRLEDDFRTEFGPAVYFILTNYAVDAVLQTDSSERHVELGRSGLYIPPLGQSINIATGPALFSIPYPADFDAANYSSLVVYCESALVVFGVAGFNPQ